MAQLLSHEVYLLTIPSSEGDTLIAMRPSEEHCNKSPHRRLGKKLGKLRNRRAIGAFLNNRTKLLPKCTDAYIIPTQSHPHKHHPCKTVFYSFYVPNNPLFINNSNNFGDL